jgi:predicted enzyme related to lactoylglutathione lyase
MKTEPISFALRAKQINMSEHSFLGLRTVTYKVPDLELAKIWYNKAFGTEPYFDEPFYVGYNIAGFELGLIPDASFNAESGGVTAYWGVPDVDVAFQRLVAANAAVESGPEDVGSGIMVAVVKDPWNNAIGIIYNPFFKADL